MLQKTLFSLSSSNTHQNIPFNFQFFSELKAKGSSVLKKFTWVFQFLFYLGFTKVYFYFEGVSNTVNLLKKEFFLKLRFTPCKTEQPLKGMELQEKD